MARPLGSPIPEITSDGQEEGLLDLVFGLENHNELPDGTQQLVAVGRAGDHEVSFRADLGASWRRSTLEDTSFRMSQGTVTLRSLGPRSDRLIGALQSLYDTHLGLTTMASEIAFTAVSLEGDPADLRGGPLKLKLFFEGDDEDDYAEIYLNVDMDRARVDLNEKEPEYREPLLRALAGTK
jgi:hypothetical protein